MGNMSNPTNQNEFNRRDFLKTSLVASVAATTVGVATAGENTPPAPSAATDAKTGRPSLIRVTNTSFAPLRKPWKNAIAVDLPATLLRANLQSQLAKLQRNIGYRYIRTYGFLQDEMAMVARRKDGAWRSAGTRRTRHWMRCGRTVCAHL